MAVSRLALAATLIVAGLAPALAQDAPSPAGQAAPAADPSEDEMADLLNSRQQLSQGVTLKRKVNGEVVETRKETLTYKPGDPLRSSESVISPLDRLKAQFDQDVLTRREALEEAELDFVLADKDRNGWLTEEEFAGLVGEWREGDIRSAALGDTRRQTRFVDYHDGLAAAAADQLAIDEARAKYQVMVAGRGALTKREFLREVSAGFDAADANEDGLLRDVELIAFRAAARGEVEHEDAIVAAPLPPVAPETAPAASPDSQ